MLGAFTPLSRSTELALNMPQLGLKHWVIKIVENCQIYNGSQ